MAEYIFSNATAVITSCAKLAKHAAGATGHKAVGLEPAAGNTCVVEVTLADDPNDAGAVWYAWDSGPVTAATMDVLYAGVSGIRARRTVGSADGNKFILYP